MPKIGISRFIVVAENEKEALGAARRAYLLWRRSFYHLYQLRGGAPAHERPQDFDEVMNDGLGLAGTPDTVAVFLQSQLAEAAANYLVGQFAFGDLSLAESLRSVELFAAHIMPRLSITES